MSLSQTFLHHQLQPGPVELLGAVRLVTAPIAQNKYASRHAVSTTLLAENATGTTSTTAAHTVQRVNVSFLTQHLTQKPGPQIASPAAATTMKTLMTSNTESSAIQSQIAKASARHRTAVSGAGSRQTQLDMILLMVLADVNLIKLAQTSLSCSDYYFN